MSVSSKQKSIINRLKSDPVLFISMLKIIDKTGRLIDFELNDEQHKVVESLSSNKSTIVVKPRQIGVSTVVAAYFFWKWWATDISHRHCILSHKMSSSKKLFEMYNTFYDSLEDFLKPQLSKRTGSELVKSNGATLFAASAQGDGGLRSFTANSIHISEYAFTENAEELKATALSALNDGQLVIESTAKSWGDPLHLEVQNAAANNYNLLQFFWWQHASYSEVPPDDYNPSSVTDHLGSLIASNKLTSDQVYWWEKMRLKMGEKCIREYPTYANDPFRQGSKAWLTNELDHVQSVETLDSGTQLLQQDSNDTYVLGVDTALGRGGDPAAIVVLSCRRKSPIYIWKSNTADPMAQARQVHLLAEKFKAYTVNIEENNTGIAVIENLKNIGFTRFWRDSNGKMWSTNASSKPLLLEQVRQHLVGMSILDQETIEELKSWQIDDNGRPTPGSSAGSHGDVTIALGLALIASQNAPLQSPSAYLPQWVLNERHRNIRQRVNNSALY